MKKILGVSIVGTFLALLFTMTQSSCYYDKENQLYPYNASCDTTNVKYSTVIKPIMSAYCYSCHSTVQSSIAGGGYDLENFASLTSLVNNGHLICDIEQTGCDNMPKNGGKISDCYISQIKVWKAAGTPNN